MTIIPVHLCPQCGYDSFSNVSIDAYPARVELVCVRCAAIQPAFPAAVRIVASLTPPANLSSGSIA